MATATAPTQAIGVDPPPTHGSSLYELFIGVLTIFSLAVMAFALLIRDPEVDAVLFGVDALLCAVFLFDFGRSLKLAPDRTAYLFGERPGRSVPNGVVDFLGSIPSIGIFRFFRVFRLARLARLVRARGARGLAREFVARRAESAVYIIVLLALLVVTGGSMLVAYFEPGAEGANILTGADAIWWAFVTITTVGYGDRFPVTEGGRVVAILTMAVGIGIFGVLTSYLSSIFMAQPAPQAAAEAEAAGEAEAATNAIDVASPSAASDVVAAELRALRAEIADLRRILEAESASPG